MSGLNRLIPAEAITHQCVSGFIADNMVSFNIRRDEFNNSARPVTLLPQNGQYRPVVPGLINRTDSELKQKLAAMKLWEETNRYVFVLHNNFYSFLWRFRKSDSFVKENIRDQSVLPPRNNRDVKRLFRDYRNHLKSNLAPGNVFLLPDAEIKFQNPRRNTKPYARRVLILAVYQDRLLIVPFSTQLHLMNTRQDIYFDSSATGQMLASDLDGPAIESWKYKLFSVKSFLCIAGAQLLTTDDFLNAALGFVCAVRKDVIIVAKEKLKKIGLIRFS